MQQGKGAAHLLEVFVQHHGDTPVCSFVPFLGFFGGLQDTLKSLRAQATLLQQSPVLGANAHHFVTSNFREAGILIVFNFQSAGLAPLGSKKQHFGAVSTFPMLPCQMSSVSSTHMLTISMPASSCKNK